MATWMGENLSVAAMMMSIPVCLIPQMSPEIRLAFLEWLGRELYQEQLKEGKRVHMEPQH